MTPARLTVAALILALGPCTVARAQVTIDVAKITCDQFTVYKITDPWNIAIWLSGFYHGKSNTTVVDTQKLAASADQVLTFCRRNPHVTVMNAVETIFAPPK
jgi:acid stress chaperone HdeB